QSMRFGRRSVVSKLGYLRLTFDSRTASPFRRRLGESGMTVRRLRVCFVKTFQSFRCSHAGQQFPFQATSACFLRCAFLEAAARGSFECPQKAEACRSFFQTEVAGSSHFHEETRFFLARLSL